MMNKELERTEREIDDLHQLCWMDEPGMRDAIEMITINYHLSEVARFITIMEAEDE